MTLTSQKMIVKSCRFASKSNKALNQNNLFAEIDLKDQVFDFDESENQPQKKKANIKLISIIAACALVATVTLVAILVIVVKKRTNPNVYSYEQEGIEMSSQSRDISQNSLVTPLI